MKNTISSLLLTALCSTSSMAAEAAVDTLINETADKATPHFLSAIELANADQKNEQNYAALAQAIGTLGLGKAPDFPAHWIADDEEAHEHARPELEERLKMFAQYDIKLLKALDVNGDLKTNEAELREGIKNSLLFVLDDKLKVDGDNDKKLSPKEYALAVPAHDEEKDEDGLDWHQRGHFDRDDKNSDGFLDQSEMISFTAEGVVYRAALIHSSLVLQGADTNKDGEISKEEFLVLNPKAEELWKEIVKEKPSLKLDSAYPSIYWLGMDKLKMITDA
ncbi:EF-hand domain-containing protein [Rubritalea spongiae]|uniref:EF-hand domain-containing protein n=1 Tax=Rubritalea spongiae TaxID=430797 RepID=A0ABW5E460_9BACT